MNDLLPNLIARRDELIQLKKNAELRLQNLNYKGEPEYHIRVDSSKNQFYIIGSDNNTKRKYLSSKKTESAQQIASYVYLKSVLKRIDTELAHIEKLIKFCINTSPEAYYESLSKGRQKLINPIRLTDEQFIEKWMSESYVGCEFEEGDSEFYTDRNERVRSKSEILIANALAKYNVPYKYECPIVLKGLGKIYPDFKALNVKRRKFYYWEHLGRMDDEDYARKNAFRINVYQKNGIYLGDNLILTMETSTLPIDVKLVNQIIKHYLL